MKDLYEPHYSYLLDTSYKDVPFDIPLRHRRPIYVGPSCKCVNSSGSRKRDRKLQELPLRKLPPSVRQSLHLDKNTFFEYISQDSSNEEFMEELKAFASPLFKETWNSSNLSNYFEGVFKSGIIYHSGQLKTAFQRHGSIKIFITKPSGNNWIDKHFLSFFLRSLHMAPKPIVVDVYGEDLPPQPAARHDDPHLIVKPEHKHLLRSTLSALTSQGGPCCLIVEDSFNQGSFLSSLTECLMEDGLKGTAVDIIPTSFSFDSLSSHEPMTNWVKERLLGYRDSGKARVDFDEPFDLKTFLDHLLVSNNLKKYDISSSVLSSEVTNHTYVSSYRNQRIMPLAFVAFVLAFNGRKHLREAEILKDMEYFIDLFHRRGIDLGFSGDTYCVLNYGASFLEKKRAITRKQRENAEVTLLLEDYKPYFLSELYPAIWADVLLFNSIASLVDMKDVRNYSETSIEHKALSQSLIIQRAIWLDSLIEVRLLKPCEDLEGTLLTHLDNLINDCHLLHANWTSSGGKRCPRIEDEDLEDYSRPRDDGLRLSTQRRTTQALSFYKGLIDELLRDLLRFSQCLLDSPLEECLSTMSKENANVGMSAFIRHGILSEEDLSLSKEWSEPSKVNKLISGIYMFL